MIEDYYRRCDEIAIGVLEYVNDDTLLIVLSDHGCGSFQRGVHLNAWLHQQGLMNLRNGCRPGDDGGNMLRNVDWPRTQAYSIGLGGIYLNISGREAKGSVRPEEADELKRQITDRLTGLKDSQQGRIAVRQVRSREQLYHGPFTDEAPDLLVHFAEGYRASWGTALGDVPDGLFEDNTRPWSGDHIVDPQLVPGVLLMNRPFRSEHPGLLDLAPTILAALGVPKAPAMEGKDLLA